MSLIEQIKDGQMVNDKTSTSSASTKSKTDSTKEMFLQLLVTEMQYQDPLQPTDNSEYVKEMATFSQVEALNSVSDKMNELQASALVGNYVTITDSDGNNITGCVEYVTTDSDDIKVSVEGKLYEIDLVTTVQDPTYYEAGVLADTFSTLVGKLPSTQDVLAKDAEDVAKVRAIYNALTDYQKTFISQSDITKLEALEKKLGTAGNTTTTNTDSSTASTTNA